MVCVFVWAMPQTPSENKAQNIYNPLKTPPKMSSIQLSVFSNFSVRCAVWNSYGKYDILHYLCNEINPLLQESRWECIVRRSAPIRQNFHLVTNDAKNGRKKERKRAMVSERHKVFIWKDFVDSEGNENWPPALFLFPAESAEIILPYQIYKSLSSNYN